MTDITAAQIIETTHLFGGLSARFRGELAQAARVLQLRRGQLIFEEGELPAGIYCVHSGLVRIVKDAPSGKQLVLHFAGPHQTFAEVAVFGNFRTPARAEAVEDSVSALIAADRVQSLLATHHELCLELLGGMAHWVRSLVGLIDDVVLKDAVARVARYLRDAAPSERGRTFQLQVLKKDLALHLNLTQETLSRTLRRLTEAGLILSEPAGLRVIDPERLEAVAEGGLP